MFSANDHGGGVAWREGGLVHWKKGLDEAEMQEFVAALPLPFVAHFRIASCGAKSKELCHPFPVSKDASLALEGTTKGYVLFHNGHWAEWKPFTKETALKMGRPLPTGQWSDTRAMAWAAHNYGLGIWESCEDPGGTRWTGCGALTSRGVTGEAHNTTAVSVGPTPRRRKERVTSFTPLLPSQWRAVAAMILASRVESQGVTSPDSLSPRSRKSGRHSGANRDRSGR